MTQVNEYLGSDWDFSFIYTDSDNNDEPIDMNGYSYEFAIDDECWEEVYRTTGTISEASTELLVKVGWATTAGLWEGEYKAQWKIITDTGVIDHWDIQEFKAIKAIA